MPRTATLQRDTSETRIKLLLDLDPAPSPAAPGTGTAPGTTPRAASKTDSIDTGVGFFDHMLHHIARHGRIGLAVTCTGDTHIDDHHTVEDVGIVLGQALHLALGDKRGIERYGHAAVPMDETLARCALDLSGRPALVFRVPWTHYAITPPAHHDANATEKADADAEARPGAEASGIRSPSPSNPTDAATSPRIVGSTIAPFDVQLVEEFFNAVTNNARLNLHLEVPWGTNNHHIAEALFKSFGRALHMALQITHDQVPSTKGVL